MINKEKFKEQLLLAEDGNEDATLVVVEVLRPTQNDSVDDILEKITLFMRLIFLGSLKFKDAPHHKKIDRAYAENVYNFINYGRPKYKGLLIYGYRESAKTARVKMCESYCACYVPDMSDLNQLVSEDGSSAEQTNMDFFNYFALSRIARYFGDMIDPDHRKNVKKESQSMKKFTLTNNVTFTASSARKPKRGANKSDIEEEDVTNKRPKKVIFDDIENERTVASAADTLKIRAVIQSTIDGLDQIVGSWVLLGNFLSLRGNVAHFITKYRNDPEICVIDIPILDQMGIPTWPEKYVRTDEEERELAKQGILKKSVESLERQSDNFDTEFMNNPSRNSVYFDDELLIPLEGDHLILDKSRDSEGLIILEDPLKDQRYLMIVDVSKGTGRDQSAFTILKLSGIRFEEVANFKSNEISPENLAPYSANIAERYNHAMILPENNYPGNEYIAFLRGCYNNIYRTEDGIDDSGNPVYIYGISTNLKTKPEMFVAAKRVLKDKLLMIRSKETYHQLSEYPHNEVLTIKRDGSGGHFDLLMTLVIGLWKAPALIGGVSDSDLKVNAKLKTVTTNAFVRKTNYR